MTQRPYVSRETACRGRPGGALRGCTGPRAGRARPTRAARRASSARRRSASRRSATPPRRLRATCWTRWPACRRSTRLPRARWRTSAAAAVCRVSCWRRCDPARETHLIEATARKAAFIAEAAAELGLRVHVHAERSEELGRGGVARRLRLRRGESARAAAGGRRAVPAAVPARRARGAVVARASRRRARRRSGGAGRSKCSSAECPGVLVIGKLVRDAGAVSRGALEWPPSDRSPAPRSDRPRR